ncbi:MAG: lysozyme [Enterobacter sp.]|jgi:GH24 family phage-related lysozyme (muramidase)|nr:lysozyme [Enterobacter sp.]
MTYQLLQISLAGINLIKKYQGLSLEKYRDESGLWVIGYGHIVSPADCFGDIITPSQAEILLSADIDICEQFLHENIGITLGQFQYDALISLIFSCGKTQVMQTGILNDIAQGNYAKATEIWRHEQMLNGKYIPSLAALRQAECELFTINDCPQSALSHAGV